MAEHRDKQFVSEEKQDKIVLVQSNENETSTSTNINSQISKSNETSNCMNSDLSTSGSSKAAISKGSDASASSSSKAAIDTGRDGSTLSSSKTAIGTCSESVSSNSEETSNLLRSTVQCKLGTSEHFKTSGLLRHRLIVAACLSLAAGLLILSTLDLRSFVVKKAYLDKNMNIHYEKERPELPASFSYKFDVNRPVNSITLYEPRNTDAQNIALEAVQESTWDKVLVGFVDPKGKVRIKPKFADAGQFSDDLASAKLPGKDQKWGYIDKSGNFALRPQFDEVSDFEDGVAAVHCNDVGGLIDRTGKFIFKAKMSDTPRNISYSFYRYQDTHGKQIFINKQGKILENVDSIESIISSSVHQIATHPSLSIPQYFKFEYRRLYGIIDYQGKVIIPAQYSQIDSFNKNVAAVLIDDKCCFVDTAGKTLFKTDYSETTPYDDLIAGRKKDQEWHLMNNEFKLLPVPPIDSPILHPRTAIWLNDGLAAVLNNRNCYYLTKDGKPAFKKQWRLLTAFANGFASVWDGQDWYLLNTNGEYATKAKFVEIDTSTRGEVKVSIPGVLYKLFNSQRIEYLNRNNKEWKDNIDKTLGRISKEK